MKWSIIVAVLAISGAAARADDLDDRYHRCMAADAHEPPSVKPRPLQWKPGFEHCAADFNDWHERDNAAKADPAMDPPNVKVWKDYLKNHPEKQQQ